MAAGRLNRWLLINYAGYPFTSSSLMPDNGLANLAGIIVAGGGDVTILDYSTVSTVARMTSPELQHRLTRAWTALRSARPGALAALRKGAAVMTLPGAERERQRLQASAVVEIGDELVAHIRNRNIEAVGFKLWNGDGLAGSAALATRIRKACPEVKLFGGGPHVDLFRDRLLRYCPAFDALIYGEGEDTLRRLANEGANPAAYPGIPNLIYRDGATIRMTDEAIVADLNELPLPIYDPAVYPAMAGDEKIKIIVIDESRGCRNECAFCIHPVKSHRQVRMKSIDRLLKEVRRLQDGHGFRAFRFAGSCTPYSLLNAFAGEIRRHALDLRYASFAHIHGGAEADFELIRKSGCVALFFGIESGSQRILDGLRKRIQASEIVETLQRARQSGLFTVGSLIFPAPGDDAQSEAETLDLVRKLDLGSITLQPPIVLPRTQWFENPGAYGFTLPDPERYLEIGMTWKVKLQLPPRFWDPLPIRLNGDSYRAMLGRTGAFSKKLGTLGIPTAISDENYLMSQLAGLDATSFRDRSLAAFYAGDSAVIRDLVGAINRAGVGSEG